MLRAPLDTQFDPHRSVIAGAFPTPHLAVDPAGPELAHQVLAQEEMVEPQSAVPLPAVSHVIPEGVERRIVRIEFSQRIGPSLLEKRRISRAGRRLYQRIVAIGGRDV